MENSKFKIVAIILSGGESKRAEQIKGLRDFHGKLWVEHIISQLNEMPIDHLHIGLGFHYEHYLNKITSLKTQSHKLSYSINPTPELGPFSTLKNALNNIHLMQFDYILLCHIDRPLPAAQALLKLLNHLNLDVIKPRIDNKSGHPILFSKAVATKIVNTTDHLNLRDLLQSLPYNRINYIDINDPNILINLNTFEDWENFKLNSAQT